MKSWGARIAALIFLGLVLVLVAAPAALAAGGGSYTGGVIAADSATYVANDHTVTAVRFSASAGLAASTTYYVKIRFSPSTAPVSGANHGFIWNSATSQWVQSDDATWTDFPSIATDGAGLPTTNAWYYVKFGDTRLSGTYHWIVSLSLGGSGTTLNGTSAPAVTVLDMTAPSGGGFWVHNGAATGTTGAKRAEVDAGGTTTLWSLQRTEPNVCDDNADGIVDNEDYGPAGNTGDFRMAVPTGLAFDVLLQSAIWPTGASSFTGATSDVDIALGAADQTPPDAPTGLSATAHNASVALSWTAATDDVGVTGYTIYRWVDLGSAVETAPAVAIGTTTETTYTDSTAANDTTYHYLVRAHDAATNEGPRSNEATATPDGTPPGPVTGATFTPGDQVASIAWTNPGDPDWSATTVVRNDSHQPADAADGTAVYSGAGTAYDDSSLTNGATYYYGVFARDTAGNWSSGVFGSVVPQGKTTLTLTPLLLVVPWRGAVQLSGHLTSDAALLGGKQVVLESSPGGGVWSFVRNIDSIDGSYSVLAAAHLRQKTMYRLRFAGDAGYASSQSAPVTATPHVLLGTPSAPLRVRHGVAFTSTGTLQPRHPAGQRSVRILCYRLRSGTWVLKLTVNAANLNYSTYSKYRARFALPSAGRWRVRAYHPADALHAATKSTYRYLTVT
jgi:hypothetical protein